MPQPSQDNVALAVRAKAVLRRHMLGVLATTGRETLEARQNKLTKNLLGSAAMTKAKRVGMFERPDGVALADLSAVRDELMDRGCELAYPRVDFDHQQVTWSIVGDRSLLRSRGLLTKEAPEGATTIQPSTLDVILVPVLGMDATGTFIGDGSGVYDHVLGSLPNVTAIAVGFSFQMIPDAPRTSRDRLVAWLVTDDRVTEARGESQVTAAMRQIGSSAAKEVHRASNVHRGTRDRTDRGSRHRLEPSFERESGTTH